MQNSYLNALNLISSLGPKRIRHLLAFFKNNTEKIWRASLSELKNTKLPSNVLNAFLYERKSINPELEWEKLEKLNIKILSQDDNNYPKLLLQIPVPPPILYIKGTLDPNFPFCIAVVGSRKISLYGRQVTEEIVYDLALNKIVIVSGLALGVDALAHTACLKAQTPTIAILANGLDKIYPSLNYSLSQQILEQRGALLSEFPINTPPLKQNFPRRNRIISGLAQAVLITEATLKSGSLITASHALEQNRDVFAVPGSIYNKNSEGTNNLIKQGAKLITNAMDILSELNLQKAKHYVQTRKALPSSPIQQKIYDTLSKEPTFIDLLIKRVELSAQEVNSALTLMEIKGMVKNVGGGQYVII